MERSSSNGGGGSAPAFRFSPAEVSEMEAIVQQMNYAIPDGLVLDALANKFTASRHSAGGIQVQSNRYCTGSGNAGTLVWARNSWASKGHGRWLPWQPTNIRKAPPQGVIYPVDDVPVQYFEAKPVRDGAWYDVSTFLFQRGFETNNPAVRVRFSGLGREEDEWVNVRACLRQRSLPYEARHCAIVVPGDHILCFQERDKHALYFDARVVDLHRRNHDARGCRCRFLVRYGHDHSEEIVPLRKMCRRPETNYRLQILNAMTRSEEASTDPFAPTKRS